jgi:hypothetical protein
MRRMPESYKLRKTELKSRKATNLENTESRRQNMDKKAAHNSQKERSSGQ